jgi:hypothetical protein
MKIQGLISEYFTTTIDFALKKVRLDENISDEDFDKLLSEAGNQVFEILEEKIAEFFVNKYTVQEFQKQQEISKRNSEKIVELHEDLFHYFFAYVHTAHIVYSNFLKQLQTAKTEASDLELKDIINISMYGNLCRMADQIGLQMIHGYSDGALRLWRTFYEHCVVSVFLMKHNSNELAERFRDVTFKENKRSVESYSKRHADLKFPALDPDLINKVAKEFEEAKLTYDKDFFDNDYSWAKPFLKTKPNFNALEEDADFGRYRPFYIWASSKAHPSYKGIMDFRDSKESIVFKYITIQEVDRKSMVDPAQLTLGAFDHVNSFFLHLYSGHEYEINMLMFRKLYDRFSETITEEKVNKQNKNLK